MNKNVCVNKGPESAPIKDSSFWRFNIWNPALSSSTTQTTTPPTTGTITTRGPSTTTPNTAVMFFVLHNSPNEFSFRLDDNYWYCHNKYSADNYIDNNDYNNNE